MTEWAILIGAFAAGLLWGAEVGKWKYKCLLVLLARARSAEKLPDGRFYYLVPESEWTRRDITISASKGEAAQ